MKRFNLWLSVLVAAVFIAMFLAFVVGSGHCTPTARWFPEQIDAPIGVEVTASLYWDGLDDANVRHCFVQVMMDPEADFTTPGWAVAEIPAAFVSHRAEPGDTRFFWVWNYFSGGSGFPGGTHWVTVRWISWRSGTHTVRWGRHDLAPAWGSGGGFLRDQQQCRTQDSDGTVTRWVNDAVQLGEHFDGHLLLGEPLTLVTEGGVGVESKTWSAVRGLYR